MQDAKTHEHRWNSCHLSTAGAAPRLRALTLPVAASSCLSLCIAPVAPVGAFSVEGLSALGRNHCPVRLRSVWCVCVQGRGCLANLRVKQ